MFFLTTPAAASGYPHITCGKVYDLPVGFPFGKAYSEPELIEWRMRTTI
jgi:hypothetical protein